MLPHVSPTPHHLPSAHLCRVLTVGWMGLAFVLGRGTPHLPHPQRAASLRHARVDIPGRYAMLPE
jgi:hypothetical protein